ncbi:MAG: 30S ribosomal protein S8 [Parcubacteria group bacterium]
MTDPIADMLTRIRNASLAKKAEVLVPLSKIKLAIAKILEKEKYVAKVEIVEDGFKSIRIVLKYENKMPAITSLKRVSKVGCRVYVGKSEIPRVLNNLGVAILSTSKGILTNREAKKMGLGGELICEIY